MSVPAAYTAEQLTTYMLAALGQTATALGWIADDLDEAVIDTLILYGVTEIASATDIDKLRACARLALWRAVEAATAGNIDFAEDQQSFKDSQIHAQAVEQVKRARINAAKHGVDHSIGILRVRRRDDPYKFLTDAQRKVTS